MRLGAGIDHVIGKRSCGPTPQWKHRHDSSAGKLAFAVGPYILPKQVAENHVRHLGCSCGSDGLCHFALIDFIWAWIGDMNDNRAQIGGIELRAQKFFTHPVHADSLKRIGHRGQSADNFEIAGDTHLMQRPRAVFAARPCDEGLG